MSRQGCLSATTALGGAGGFVGAVWIVGGASSCCAGDPVVGRRVTRVYPLFLAAAQANDSLFFLLTAGLLSCAAVASFGYAQVALNRDGDQPNHLPSVIGTCRTYFIR